MEGGVVAQNALGKLEQDVVFGDAKSKDIIKLLGEKTNLMQQDKVRRPRACAQLVYATRWGPGRNVGAGVAFAD